MSGGRQPIAIVGMACRLPGADSVEEFWSNLENAIESIRRLTEEDLDGEGIPSEVWHDPAYVRAAAPIAHHDSFDYRRLGLSRREAELRAPQHRVFLECALEAFEDAGHDPSRFVGSIGVFAGISQVRYHWFHLYPNRDVLQSAGELGIQTANDPDYLPTIVSYLFDLHGPSVNVNCACSTSLMAVHLACQSLLLGESDMALAGGVTVRLPHLAGYHYQQDGILSPDGHCRVFDKEARGTVFGSGAGVIVLRRLDDALRDGDRIRAIVLGSAANNDGGRKISYTAPGVDGQARVVATALEEAGIGADRVGYVEAHGTGTIVGDPIEVTALTDAFRCTTDGIGTCAVGSVKSNIGHSSAAAGVAGLIKSVLALEHCRIPPSLWYREPNPHIRFEETPFFVNTVLADWPRGLHARIAGVSAFGIGGTNVHIVLQEAPDRAASGPARPWQVVTLSAATDSALRAGAARLGRHLDARSEESLADVCFTLAVGRQALPHRAAASIDSVASAARMLKDWATELPAADPAQRRDVVFAFPGQGAQEFGMADDLYRVDAQYRAHFDACAALFEPLIRVDLRRLLYPTSRQRGHERRLLDETWLAQPALFAVEYALARTLEDYGVLPAAALGHSLGECVAACMAGVMDLSGAAEFVAERGRLMQAAPKGAMTAFTGGEEVLDLIKPPLSMAAVNGPGHYVASGPSAAVATLEAALSDRSIPWRRLRTSHGFHSATMDETIDPIIARAARVRLATARLEIVSSLTGDWVRPDDMAVPEYWGRQLRETVRWSEALGRVLEGLPGAVVLEVGPGSALTALARRHPARMASHLALACLGAASPSGRAFMDVMAQLWARGIEVDWTRLYGHERRRRVSLPRYAFERERCWPAASDPQFRASAPRATRADTVRQVSFAVPTWRQLPPQPCVGPRQALRRLLLVGDEPVARAVCARAAAGGFDTISVRAGKHYSQPDDSSFVIDPGDESHYRRLLAELGALGWVPSQVEHYWSLDPRASSEDHRFVGLLHLARALARAEVRAPVHIGVITRGVHAVLGSDHIFPENATLLGIARVLPKESTHQSCSLVDIEVHPDDRVSDELVDDLLRDVSPAAPAILAYRAGRRWIPAYEPVDVPPAGLDDGPFRSGGVYLITGGFGGLGLAIASYLAEHYGARLALLGRSPLPPEEAWDNWVRNSSDEGMVARRLRALRRLQLLCTDMVLLTGDVADTCWLRTAVARVRERLGPINGIVHAAGVPGGGMLELKSADAAKAVMRPKVDGASALLACDDLRELDFLVLFSSVTAVTGEFGQADYCAANCFLDALARSLDSGGSGPHVVSIDWDAWREVGMAVEARRPSVVLPERRRDDGMQLELADWMLTEHRIDGVPVLPGTSHVELAIRALTGTDLCAPLELRDVVLLRPLQVQNAGAVRIGVTLEPSEDAVDFKLTHVGETLSYGRAWLHLDGKRSRHNLAKLREMCSQPMRPAEGFVQLGDRFRCVKDIWAGEGCLLTLLELADSHVGDLEHHILHPALLDRALAVGPPELRGRYLPASYGSIRVYGRLPRRLYSWIRYKPAEVGPETATWNAVLMDDDGNELCVVERFTVRRVHGRQERPRPLDHGLTTEAGVDAFHRVLAAGLRPQVVVTARPLAEIVDRIESLNVATMSAAAERPKSPHDGQAGGRSHHEPADEVEAAVARSWTDATGDPPADLSQDFFDAGGNSLLGLQMLARLKDELGVELNVADLFDNATFESLCGLIRGRLPVAAAEGR